MLRNFSNPPPDKNWTVSPLVSNKTMANYHISVAQFSVSVSVLLTMDFSFFKVTFYCCRLSF